MAADLDFFFDPVCPWAWITSRWVTNASEQRSYEIDWRFISLWIINEENSQEWYTPEYRAGHYRGHQALRVADSIRLGEADPSAVGRWYTAVGTAVHVEGRRKGWAKNPQRFLGDLLKGEGFDAVHLDAMDDDTHDEHLRAETELAFSRTGRDVGTPILTFHPGADNEASFFGPVISKAPTGQDAVELWDAVEKLATMSGMAELKRSNRMAPDFT